MAFSTQSPPYFHALAAFICKKNRLYRIFVRPDELIFIWAGSGMEGVASTHRSAAGVAAHGGLIGWLLGTLIVKMLDPTRQNAARKAVLDATPLEQLIADHAKNFRAPINEFDEVRIGPRSERHARAYSDHDHQALLYLRHRALGKYRLGIASVEDVQVAITELPRAFAELCQVEIEWSERDEKFIKRGDKALSSNDAPIQRGNDPTERLKAALRKALALESRGEYAAAIEQFRLVAKFAGKGHPSAAKAHERIQALQRKV